MLKPHAQHKVMGVAPYTLNGQVQQRYCLPNVICCLIFAAKHHGHSMCTVLSSCMPFFRWAVWDNRLLLMPSGCQHERFGTTRTLMGDGVTKVTFYSHCIQYSYCCINCSSTSGKVIGCPIP